MPPLLRTSTITFRAILLYLFVGLAIIAFVAYVLFQARFIIAGPQILLTEELDTAQTQRMIVLQGEAKNIVRMTLNGRQIYTDKYGNFKEALVLENGYTITTLQAEDRYGRETNLTKKFVYMNADNHESIIN